MPKQESLVEKLDRIVDGYYGDSADYEEIKKALEQIEREWAIIEKSSLARDGSEMIEAALRGEDDS